MYDFAKGVNFDVRGQGRKSTRDKTLKKLLNHQLLWLRELQQ